MKAAMVVQGMTCPDFNASKANGYLVRDRASCNYVGTLDLLCFGWLWDSISATQCTRIVVDTDYLAIFVTIACFPQGSHFKECEVNG